MAVSGGFVVRTTCARFEQTGSSFTLLFVFVGVRSTLSNRDIGHYRGPGGNWPSHVTDDEVIRPDETAIVEMPYTFENLSSLDCFFIDPSLLTVTEGDISLEQS